MSTRRSARIRNIDLGVTAEPTKPALAPAPAAPPKRKRKAPAEDEKDEPTTKGKKGPAKKVKATKVDNAKTKSKANATAEIETQKETVPVPDDVLSVLPAEILQQILESVNDPKSMVKMACTSKRYYALVMAIIHKRISVSTSFWAHIPHVIRRIEPHLSIAQKKQLKREGQYKGQQEKFSTRLDPNAVPPCASNVRQMIIGKIDPGKKHKPLVLRYFEEVLKNLHNLEVFDAEDLTERLGSFSGEFCENMMPNITRAFDFLKLRELNLMGLEEGQLTFFKHLEDLFSKADKRDIHLRKLCLEMKGPDHEPSYAETEVHLEGMYRFISSFDSLTSLEIHDYNMYNSAVQSNPGLSRRLLQSVVKHTGLETLRFHYRHMGIESWEIPYASAETVNILIKNLPSLRVFEFAPQVTNLDAMARALSRAKNLTTLLYPNFKNYHSDPDNAQVTFAKTLLGDSWKTLAAVKNSFGRRLTSLVASQ
ncbi:hypothetical protein Forpi1262_v012286 [Fusarium oxysporum f. sp. raphani]|uniref:F-box domain-containing protein n=1 Tax=Fusarium oxysporum f. sp. raphani TaxID=96318 RepID=A0A8J5PUD1_FUSOX|nr:hypothetical protein Forpi1262_v012286 [Fusarium oxysporum f. sp. raphani]